MERTKPLMQSKTPTYINFVDFTSLFTWSVAGLLEAKFNYAQHFELAPIGDFLVRSREIEEIQDEKLYKRVTVRINNKGVVQRDEEFGKNIGTKRQYIARAGQFIVSKIDARNGAFGIIPANLDGAIVTNDFPVFNVDKQKILPQFLLLITTTKHFIKFAQSCSSGTTNRQRMDIPLFLEQKIPLPAINEQRVILDTFNKKVENARRLHKENLDDELEIDRFFLKSLGLPQFEIKTKTKGLLSVEFADLDRWDFFSTDVRIAQSLEKSKYSTKTIGSFYEVAKRPWDKRKEKNKYFKYIEIGAIDPIEGIVEAKEIPVIKAPSRATQIVKEGDLIVGTTRPYLKKFAIVTKEFDRNVCSSGFTIFSNSEKYYLPFLKQFLKSTYGLEQLKSRMTGGLYPAITEGELMEIKLPIPEKQIQIDIMQTIAAKEKRILGNKFQIDNYLQEAELEFEKSIFN